MIFKMRRNHEKLNRNRKQTGFTLLEVLVAFSVLVITFGVFVSVTTGSMKAFRHAENSHLASKMAKEGIELVINKKDNNKMCLLNSDCLEVSDWREGLGEGEYEVSSARPAELLPGGQFLPYDGYGEKPPNRSLCFLSGDVHKGKFGYCTGPLSVRDDSGIEIPGAFKRKIIIEDLATDGNPDGILVRSVVKWYGGNEMPLETFLYNPDD